MNKIPRKYVSLIHSISYKWATWDPSVEIKVGDYGTIDKETGRLEQEGNIYDDPLTADLASKHLPIDDSSKEQLIVPSFGAQPQDLKNGATSDVPGMAEASIKGQWKFGKSRGGVLIMARPRSRHVPPNVFLKQLTEVPFLEDKALVTEVISCPAYAIYLSKANEDPVSIALVEGAPETGSVTTAGGETPTGRWNHNGSGIMRDGYDRAGDYSFKPLFTLRKIRKPSLFRRREGPQPEPEGDDLWIDAHNPWEMLDDEGEEEEWEDTVFDL